MNRLLELFERNRREGKKLLSIFVTAGYPVLQGTPDLVCTLEQAGADFVELGLPFSDPIADGPTIQESSTRALENGMTLSLALRQVREIRERSNMPILMMGYFNPLFRYGLDRLVTDAEAAGVDGFIIPDLLPEDYSRFEHAFSGRNIGVNFLVSPNTAHARIQTVDRLTDAFIYCVSVTGVTGTRRGVPAGLIEFLAGMKESVVHPVLVGFGISNGEDAATLARHCDGVIVGSAVIKILSQPGEMAKKYELVSQFVGQLKESLKGVE
ncbi:MAG: tryptophan synthase subunit alpha [bacterium]